MVVNASELDLSPVFWAILGITGYMLMMSFAVAVLAAHFGVRRFGIPSLSLGLMIAIAVLVDAVVLFRTVHGAATAWDLLWAVGLASVGVLCARRLFPGARRSADSV